MEESLLSFNEKLEPIEVDSLLWTQKSIGGSEESVTNKRLSPKSKNVLYDRKDDILSYIKPDYGSLGEFITGVSISSDFIKQKKYVYNNEGKSTTNLRIQRRGEFVRICSTRISIRCLLVARRRQWSVQWRVDCLLSVRFRRRLGIR